MQYKSLNQSTTLNLSCSLLFPGAVDDFNKAIILNPQIPDLYKRRSQALAVLDRNQEALQDLNAAYKLLCTSVNDDDQEIIDVLIDRANMHHKRRDYNKAEKDSKVNAIACQVST